MTSKYETIDSRYFDGAGFERDVEQAAQLYKPAAQQGHEEHKKGFR